MRASLGGWPVPVITGLMAGLAGCGGNGGGSSSGSGGGGSTPPPPTAVVHVYVIQNPATFGSGSGSILQFPATSTGSVSPSSSITAPANTWFDYVATDGSGNVYTGTQSMTTNDVREYTAGSTGAATPTRTLPEDVTTMIGALQGLAASASGEIFVSEDSGAVAGFSATANGSVAPAQYIVGADEQGGGLSTLVSANDVTVDGSGNLYVANEGAPGLMPIVVFGPTATGNVAPLRSIGGALTTIAGITGMTADAAGNLYVASETAVFTGNSPVYTGSILVFGPGATGNVAPIRTISGASTTLGRLGGIKLDSAGNVYVVSESGTGTDLTVVKFAAAATGNVAPVSSFSSTEWTHADNGASLAVF